MRMLIQRAEKKLGRRLRPEEPKQIKRSPQTASAPAAPVGPTATTPPAPPPVTPPVTPPATPPAAPPAASPATQPAAPPAPPPVAPPAAPTPAPPATPPLTSTIAEKLAEVQASREATQYAEQVEAAKERGDEPPPPPSKESQKVPSVVLGQKITGGKNDAKGAHNAAITTSDAEFKAIVAGEIGKFADSVIIKIIEAGKYAYAWWHVRGLSSEFPSPQTMVDQAVTYWWNYRDDIDSLKGAIQLIAEERDDLKRRLEEATSRRAAISQVQSMVYLAAAEGTQLQPEIVAELLRQAENGSVKNDA